MYTITLLALTQNLFTWGCLALAIGYILSKVW
jgi:hypothetical protein